MIAAGLLYTAHFYQLVNLNESIVHSYYWRWKIVFIVFTWTKGHEGWTRNPGGDSFPVSLPHAFLHCHDQRQVRSPFSLMGVSTNTDYYFIVHEVKIGSNFHEWHIFQAFWDLNIIFQTEKSTGGLTLILDMSVCATQSRKIWQKISSLLVRSWQSRLVC